MKLHVPRFGRKESIDLCEVKPGRRRSASVILQHQQQLEAELATQIQPPQKVMGEEEKGRLAAHMEFRGNIPDVAACSSGPKDIHRSTRRGHKAQLERLFQDIAREIEERREHLQVMLGNGSVSFNSPAVQQLQSEIASRTQELHRTHEQINSSV